MENKRTQIQSYLKTTINPFITPLIEQLVKKRPTNLLIFTRTYIQNLINQKLTNQLNQHSDQDSSNQDYNEINQKYEQKLKVKKIKKISRQGISAQVYGQFNKKQQFIPKIIQKSNQTKSIIFDLLKQSVLFQTLGDQDMNIVVDAMSVQQQQQGNLVINQGDQGLTLYIVQSGQYQCYKNINGKQTYLKTYKTGDTFGELALMYTAPRAASIKCSESGTLYALDRQTFKHIVQGAAVKRRQKFRIILSKVSILSQIDPYQRQQLCDILHQQNYNPGDYIVRQGEQGNKFYMIASGKLIAQKNSQKVFQFNQGDYFGEISLIRNTPRQASVKCLTAVKVVQIDRSAFKRMFGSIQDILKRNQDKYIKYIRD